MSTCDVLLESCADAEDVAGAAVLGSTKVDAFEKVVLSLSSDGEGSSDCDVSLLYAVSDEDDVCEFNEIVGEGAVRLGPASTLFVGAMGSMMAGGPLMTIFLYLRGDDCHERVR